MSDLQLDNVRPHHAESTGPRAAGEGRAWRLMCVGGMTAIMAHRLAQPMTAINALASSSLKAARAPMPDYRRLEDNLAKIEQQARRATDMIRGFAQFAHRGAPDIGVVDVNEALTLVLAEFEVDIRQHGIAVKFDPTPGLPRVTANATAVEQIASCLLRNAIDATEQARGAREIAVTVSTTGDGMVEVAVADTGTGIDTELAPTLFDPFDPERPGECGVGLAVTRAIVEALGGRIGVKSNSASGAAVAFALPAEKQGDTSERRVG